MRINIMIGEDEFLAREELQYLLDKEKDFTLLPSAESGEQLLELYFEYRPDVVFLDIEIRGITGVEAEKQINASSNEDRLFVFTTQYDTYAVDTFAIESLDYLLKPFDQVRLQQTLERIRIKLRTGEQDISDTKESQAPSPASNKLLVDDGEKMIVISPESIYYA